MRWLTKLLFALLLLSGAALGQAFTQVSGIAENSSNQIYQNCTYNVTFVGQSSEPGPYLLQGSTFQQTYAGVRCDGFGNFSIRLPSNQAIFPQPSAWMFSICDSTGQFCNGQGTAVITIAGSTQNITSIIQPLLPSLPTTGGGAVSSVFGRTGAVTAHAGDYTVSLVTGAAPLASPTFTGTPRGPTVATSDNSTALATTAWVKLQGYGTGTGSVTSVFGRTGAVTATAGDYTVNLVTGAAPINNPIFTGNPQSVTPATADNSTSIATTAWVKLQGYSTGGAAGVTSFNTRTGAVVPLTGDYTCLTTAACMVTGSAPLASPALTGTPTAPTAGQAINNTQIATTAYVRAAAALLAPLASPALTGTPTGPTAAVGTSTTQLATTAFVLANQGGGGVNPGTVNVLPKYATTTTVGPSLATDNGTTLNYTGTGGIVAPKFSHGTGAFQLDSVTGALPGLPGAGHNALVSGPDGWYISDDNGAYQKISAAAPAPAPVAPSAEPATCVAQNTNTGVPLTVPFNIQAGETALVGVSIASNNPSPAPTVSDSGNSVYTQRLMANTANTHSSWLFSTAAGGALASSSITVHNTVAAKYTVCVAAFTNVSGFGNTNTNSSSTAVSGASLQVIAGPNSIVFVFMGWNSASVVSAGANGTIITQAAATAPAAAGGGICQNTTTIATTVICGFSFTPNAAHDSLGVELISPTGGGGGGVAGVVSFNNRVGSVMPQAGDYGVAQITGAAPTASPALTGTPTAPTAGQAVNSTQLATTAYVRTAVNLLAPLASPTFTGTPHAPTAAQTVNSTQLATTEFVHAAVAGATAGVSSFNTRTGAVVPTTGDYTCSTTATCMITGAAPLASPALSGTPTAPTAAQTVNNTQIASTAYVRAAITTLMVGLAGLAELNSPHFTGTPLAPTPATSSNNTEIATTEWVRTHTSALTTGVSSFNTRSGAVVPTTGDYTCSTTATCMITGAAPLSGPAFTNAPTAPTAAQTVNNQQLATTSYVRTAAANLTLSMASLAPLDSPHFTGTPTAPNPPLTTYNQQLATTQFVHDAANAAAVMDGTQYHLLKFNQNGPTHVAEIGTSDLTDNGITLHYPGAGGMTTDNPSPSDNSSRVATTAFVNSALAAGGIARIGLSHQVPTCSMQNNPATNTLTFAVTIDPGDTVMLALSTPITNAAATWTVTDNAAGGTNAYPNLVTRNQGAGATQLTTTIKSPGAGAARAATSITVTQNHNGKFGMCIAAYVGVKSIDTTTSDGGTFPAQFGISSLQDGGYLFAASAVTGQQVPTWEPGTLLNSTFSTTTPYLSFSACQFGSITAINPAMCVARWSGVATMGTIVTVEMRPGVESTNNQQLPRVVAKTESGFTQYDTSGGTSYILCTPVICPRGVYRFNYTMVVTQACTGGSTQLHLTHNDVAIEPPGSRNVALIAAPGLTFTTGNAVNGVHVFSTEGLGNVTMYRVATNCTSGTGAGHGQWVLERLW